MATELPGYKHTGYSASSDLSAKQYLAVKVSGLRTVTGIAADTDIPFGVLQNAPTSGQTAEVMSFGRTKMVASAAITAGAQIGVTAAGKAVARVVGTDTTKYVIGVAEDTAAADGDIISVYLYGSAHRAA